MRIRSDIKSLLLKAAALIFIIQPAVEAILEHVQHGRYIILSFLLLSLLYTCSNINSSTYCRSGKKRVDRKGLKGTTYTHLAKRSILFIIVYISISIMNQNISQDTTRIPTRDNAEGDNLNTDLSGDTLRTNSPANPNPNFAPFESPTLSPIYSEDETAEEEYIFDNSFGNLATTYLHSEDISTENNDNEGTQFNAESDVPRTEPPITDTEKTTLEKDTYDYLKLQTSSAGTIMPYRAYMTSNIRRSISDISKLASIKSLVLYKKFLMEITLIINNFSDASRTWNVADIFVEDALTGMLKTFPSKPSATASPKEIQDYTEACDCDNIFLSILITMVIGEAAACIDPDIRKLSLPGAGRSAFIKLVGFVRNQSNGYTQTIKKAIKAWSSTFTIRI